MERRNSIIILFMAIVLFSFTAPFHIWSLDLFASAESDQQPATQVLALKPPGSDSSMLQFRAGGHLLGFQPNKAHLVGLDHALSVEFVGTPGVMPKAAEKPGETDRISEALSLGKVVYEHLWEEIDLVYEPGEQGIAESTYHVPPGGDVSAIRLRYNVPFEMQNNGSLRFKFPSGYLTESPPVAWQDIGGNRVSVTVAFRVTGDEVGFSVGKYDRDHPLIIDPTYEWHTFYGSASSGDAGKFIAVDGSGNIYVTGSSNASWNGPGGEAPIHAFASGYDIFVLKLSSSGQYQWHTFHGAAGGEYAYGMAIDVSGNIYVTGISNATWNGSGGEAPIHAFAADTDIFVLKLASNGQYQWHTFHGAAGTDYAFAMAVDGSGNIYVTGSSNAIWNGPGGQTPLHGYFGGTEIFVLKLDGSGQYQWHTFHGSAGVAAGYGMAVDGSGNIYVTGQSNATWNGPGGESPLHSFTGNSDIFVLKLGSSGQYQWHTFHGSAGFDIGYGVAVDSRENIYVTGQSNAIWNGPGGQTPLHSFTGNSDIFVLKLGGSGQYQWHTFHGAAAGSEIGNGIAVDDGGNIYVTGNSTATWNGPTGQAPLHAYAGGYDIFLLKLGGSGQYQWHTFHGSAAGTDYGYGIAVDGGGNIYATGYGDATWNGPAGQAPLHAYAGGGDVNVLKMTDSDPVVVDFGSSGIWFHKDASWTSLSSDNPERMVFSPDSSTLFAVFGASGLWKYDGTSWSHLTGNRPQNMLVSGSKLYADFAGWGLWVYDGISWASLTGNNPKSMLVSGSKLYADFGAWGLWAYDGTSWAFLTWNSPEKMLGSGSKLYADFGRWGLWVYDGTSWASLTGNSPQNMLVSGSKLYADFADWGLWVYYGTSWASLTGNSPKSMLASGSKLYADFGALGLWAYDGTSWALLTRDSPKDMLVSGSKLYGDFGAVGLWAYDGTSWDYLTSSSPDKMLATGSKLYADFGTSGIWVYDGTSWDYISKGPSENILRVNW